MEHPPPLRDASSGALRPRPTAARAERSALSVLRRIIASLAPAEECGRPRKSDEAGFPGATLLGLARRLWWKAACGAIEASTIRRWRPPVTLLQDTFDNLDEGLSVFDAGGRLAARNARFCELLGLPPDIPLGTPLGEILGRQARDGAFGEVDPKSETVRRLEQFFREVPTIKERVTPGGRTLQIRRSAMPDGAVLSLYSDVTEIRAGERKLQQARSQAEAANRAKSEFLANMSHELRTPLNAIIGFTEIISQELFGPIGNDKYLEYVKDVHASSLHLLSIINDVLDMSKIEAGKFDLARQAIALPAVVREVMRIVHERASCRGIELVLREPGENLVLWADERALKQILLNLLSNAIKFSQDGSAVCIRLSRTGGSAAIEVEDHGVGMSEAEQARAVQPFGQAKPATTGVYGGTGLGLPITKGLVEAHDGTLVIHSRVGEGTVVRVALPIGMSVPTG